MAAAAVSLAAVASSCGGGSAAKPAAKGVQAVAQWADDLGRSSASGADDFARVARRPPPAALTAEAERLALRTQEVTMSAICAGITHIVTTGEAPSWGEWAQWATGEFAQQLLGFPWNLEQYIADRASGIAVTLTFAQENPRLALEYAKQCRVLGL